MDLGEQVHDLNLLYVVLSFGMTNCQSPWVNFHYGQPAISENKLPSDNEIIVLFHGGIILVSMVIPKQEALFASVREYESYVVWKGEKEGHNGSVK